jgi:hypothetical protein
MDELWPYQKRSLDEQRELHQDISAQYQSSWYTQSIVEHVLQKLRWDGETYSSGVSRLRTAL